MENNDPVDLIRQLLNVVGAKNYSGDASFQVIVPTKNGRWLRIGITDDDVGSGKLWHDYYPGFNNELINELASTTNEKPKCPEKAECTHSRSCSGNCI